MCGIVGAASNYLSIPEKRVVEELLVASVVRGHDSTGAVALLGDTHAQPRVRSFKWPTDPFRFVTSQQWEELISPASKLPCKAIIAHNRLATVGEVSKENAHPFNFENVIGVHNGTIQHSWGSAKKFGTDSQALYEQINNIGIAAAVKAMGRSASNPYALAFYSKPGRTLNLIRNSGRPLHVAYCTNTIYWASERQMLEWILARNQVKVDAIELLAEYKLYSWRLEGNFNPKPMVANLEPPVPVYTGNNNNLWRNQGNRPRLDSAPARDQYPPVGDVRVFDMEKGKWKTVNWRYPNKPIRWGDADKPAPFDWEKGDKIPEMQTTSQLPGLDPFFGPQPNSKTNVVSLDSVRQSGAQSSNSGPAPAVNMVWDPVSRTFIPGQSTGTDTFADCGPGSCGRTDPNDMLCDDCRYKQFCGDYGCAKAWNLDPTELAATERELSRASSVNKPLPIEQDPDEDAEEEIDDDEQFMTNDGDIVTAREMKAILETGCGGCGTEYALDDILLSDQETIDGRLRKNDRGGIDFICEACHEHIEQMSHSTKHHKFH